MRVEQDALGVAAQDQLAHRRTAAQADDDQLGADLVGDGEQVLGGLEAASRGGGRRRRRRPPRRGSAPSSSSASDLRRPRRRRGRARWELTTTRSACAAGPRRSRRPARPRPRAWARSPAPRSASVPPPRRRVPTGTARHATEPAPRQPVDGAGGPPPGGGDGCTGVEGLCEPLARRAPRCCCGGPCSTTSARERRRAYPPVLHVGVPGGPVRRARPRRREPTDPGLRADVVAALLRVRRRAGRRPAGVADPAGRPRAAGRRRRVAGRGARRRTPRRSATWRSSWSTGAAGATRAAGSAGPGRGCVRRRA